MVTTREKITDVIEGLNAELRAAFEVYEQNHKFDFTAMSYDDAHDKIGEIFADLKKIVMSVRYEDDYGLPKFIANYKSFEADGKLDYISCSVKTGLKVTTKYSYTAEIRANNIMKGIFDAFEAAIMHMASIEMAEENIKCLNERLEEVFADSDVSFKFVLGDNFVEDIDDKTILFGATIDAAFNVSSLKVMHNTEDYGEFSRVLAEEEQAKIVSAVKGRTTPQVMKSGLEIIELMTGIKPKNRADRLLRMKYHNQAKFFNDKPKAAVGYVRKTVQIDGEEADIFALLKKTDEGKVEVKLSPFNIKTTFNVDYDICSNYKD